MAESLPSRLARIEERSEAIMRELHRLGREVETFAPTAGQLIELVGDLRALADDVVELKDDLKQQGMSTTVKVAIITGCFGLLGALVLAVTQIVSAS